MVRIKHVNTRKALDSACPRVCWASSHSTELVCGCRGAEGIHIKAVTFYSSRYFIAERTGWSDGNPRQVVPRHHPPTRVCVCPRDSQTSSVCRASDCACTEVLSCASYHVATCIIYTPPPPPTPPVFLSPLRFYHTPPIGSCPDSAVLLTDRWLSFPQVFPEESETREVQRERD